MEAPQRIGKIGLAGYPGYIFLQKIRYGYGKQRYDEKRTILHNWYSALRAYLPILYEADNDDESKYKNKKETFSKIILPKIHEVAKEIEAARAIYKSTFENPETWDPDEAKFEMILEGIQERLDDITAITGIIDKAKMDDADEQEVFG